VVGLTEISTEMSLSMAWSIVMAATSDRPRGTAESSPESNMCSRHYLVLFRWVSPSRFSHLSFTSISTNGALSPNLLCDCRSIY
jgi:hypothetical protein